MIAVPNFESFSVKIFGTKDNSCLWVPEHLNYFTIKGLSKLLEKNGFEVVEQLYITRIPYFTLSNRLKVKNIFFRKLLNLCVKYLQKPFAYLANKLKIGLYINIYAIKK